MVAGLKERGLDVLLATGTKTARGDTAPESELYFPELNLRSTNAVRAALALRSIVRTKRPDVVHGHGLRLAPVLTLATATFRPAPLVVTCHGIPPEKAPRVARYLRLSRAAIASCDDGPRALLAAAGIDSFLLRYGVSPAPPPSDRVELMRSLGLSEMLALVVSPGRLVPQKDHLTAIRTIQHLPGAALVIVGDGPLRTELQTETEVLGVADRVRLVGWRSDIHAIMGAADAVLLPSRWEGFGLVAIEAMTASVPVVAASSPGFREWLVHEYNALLAPIADHQQLAVALERVLGDADLRDHLIQGGKRTGDRYTVAAMLDTHLELYKKLASRSRP